MYDELHMTSTNSGIVCCKGHTYDECSEAVCAICNADLFYVNISPLPPQPVMPSQQLEFDIDLPFYKDTIPRAPHLQDAEIKFDCDTSDYNSAPLSQSYRTKPRVHTARFFGCNIL